MGVPSGVSSLQINKWLFLKAPDGSQKLPTYDCIPPSADSSFISDGATLINTIDDNYYGMLRCGVSFDANTTWTTTITHDDGCQIYVDRVSVYANSVYTQNTSISIPFTAGVHTVDILWSEQYGGDGIFNLSTPLSTVAQGMWALLSAGGGAIPVIKARDDVTLASITDVSYTRRYYLLQSSTLNSPAAPTVNPAPSPWVTTEPSYTEGSTNSLYTVDLTVFTDSSFDYSQVSKSSSYEAAKAAYNKAVAAQSAASAAQTTANGKNKITRSTSVASGAGVAGDQWWQYSGTQIIAMWIHNGTSWVAQTLTDSVITNLNAGTITAGTINADRIAATSITGSKIAGSTITASNMVAGTITAASGIIADATIGDAQIINGSITNASIKDATIQSAKIASLDAGKITTGYLGAARIGAGSITAAKMVTGTITASSGIIADAAITNAKIADGTITNAKIGNLDAGKITTGTLNAARIAANSITADKLNANVFNGVTFTGSELYVGGGSKPQVKLGPTGTLAQPGASYGVYLSTPNNNANGSSNFEVTPVGPVMSMKNGTGAETARIDKDGVSVINQSTGALVNISQLAANAVSYTANQIIDVRCYGAVNGDSPWGAESFMRTPYTSINVGGVIQVTSPTGKLLVQSGVYMVADGTQQAGIEVQWALFTQDPTSYTWDQTMKNRYGNLGHAAAASHIGGAGAAYPGTSIVTVQPNVRYWMAPIYWTYWLGTGSRVFRINRLWVYATPTT